MAEERHEQPAQVKRPAATAEPAPKEPVRREAVPGDLITKHCAVLKDSCEEPADWIAKSADGAEIPVCDEHKSLVAINYPGVEFEYEEV